jgi:REP element-mobilizing transposase RayT
MKPLQIPLQPGKFYHIFNRGNNGENLFYKNDNYIFFLRKLDEYLSDYIELYAYCLLPNHFHLLVRIKEFETDTKNALHFQNAKRFEVNQLRTIGKPEDEISTAFLRFFTSYAKAINKQENRHGSLFENPFKRKVIENTNYLANLVFYIHSNPQMHGICNDFRQYAWSSYDRILLGKPSKLKKEDVIGWFTDKSNYLSFHAQNIELDKIKELVME